MVTKMAARSTNRLIQFTTIVSQVKMKNHVGIMFFKSMEDQIDGP